MSLRQWEFYGCLPIQYFFAIIERDTGLPDHLVKYCLNGCVLFVWLVPVRTFTMTQCHAFSLKITIVGDDYHV